MTNDVDHTRQAQVEEAKKIAKDILNWLDEKHQHLGDQSRRVALEDMLIAEFDRIRARERRKAMMQGVAFWGSLVGMAFTLFLNWHKVVGMVLGGSK